MQLENYWQKKLTSEQSAVLIISFILIYVIYQYSVVTRLAAERGLERSRTYFNKSYSLSKELVTERSIFYYRGLRMIKANMKYNPLNSRSYFVFAEAASEIADDPQLRGAIDIDRLQEGIKGSDVLVFNLLAKKYLIEAILREPTNAIYHQRLGKTYDRLSDQDDAEKELRRALILAPQDAEIHLYLSQYFFSKGKDKEFLEHIKKAIAIQKSINAGNVEANISGFLDSIGRKDLLE